MRNPTPRSNIVKMQKQMTTKSSDTVRKPERLIEYCFIVSIKNILVGLDKVTSLE